MAAVTSRVLSLRCPAWTALVSIFMTKQSK
jgi:hypothetical protein